MEATGGRVLPRRGRSLDDRRWRSRHGLLVAVLAAHIPVLAVVGALTQHAARSVLVLLGLVATLLAVGIVVRDRRLRSLGVSLGLLTCSAALVYLTGGLIEAHFHYFLAIGLIAVYHDWRPYALTAAFILVTHGVVGVLWPASMYNHADAIGRPWVYAVVHGGFMLAVSVLHLVAWRATEREQRRARRYHEQLHEGEDAVVQRLREAEEAKARLLAVASHELRTPVTAIAGLARTLTVHHRHLDRTQLADCLRGIEEHSARLSRVVDNLVAASGSGSSGGGHVELAAIVAALVDEYDDGTVRFEVAVPDRALVALGDVAARQVIGNLLDNGRKFAPPGTPVTVTARPVGPDVELEVTNVLRPKEEETLGTLGNRLFEPFVQGDSSDTRAAEGLGLGLYIVRTVAAANGGRVNLRVHAGRLTAVATLPAALDLSLVDDPPTPVRT